MRESKGKEETIDGNLISEGQVVAGFILRTRIHDDRLTGSIRKRILGPRSKVIQRFCYTMRQLRLYPPLYLSTTIAEHVHIYPHVYLIPNLWSMKKLIDQSILLH